MATANVSSQVVDQLNSPLRRRATAHLKAVPVTREARRCLRENCHATVAQLGRQDALSKSQLEQWARSVLHRQNLGEQHLGWTMVCLVSEFWRDQVAAVPINRRLLLLPTTLRHEAGCDQQGSDLPSPCPACTIARLTRLARELGYRILAAEKAVKISQMVVRNQADAILGVADLDVLEKAFDKVINAGVPCMAVPLPATNVCQAAIDEDWIREMIRASAPDAVLRTPSYIHLMRFVRQMFEADKIEQLVPRTRGKQRLSNAAERSVSELEPLAATEAVAYDFLIKGGKYSRPFITLAVYDALTGGHGTSADGARQLEKLSGAVMRAAVAIETFHKASLVHDDIEDDDEFRYGQLTLHRRWGIPTAINVGDFLIGMGYRLVARDQAELGPRTTASILAAFAEAHHQLSEGQGAELFWRDANDKQLTPADALTIYRLKTSPAFEASLVTGAALAEQEDIYRALFHEFAHSLGVGFQVLNDLKDWRQDDDNKLTLGADALGGRPTLLLALALGSLNKTDQVELLKSISDRQLAAQQRLLRVKELFAKANVFRTARDVVDQHRRQAERLAAQARPAELQRLLHYLVEIVLDRPS